MRICIRRKTERKNHVENVSKVCVRTSVRAKRIARSHETESCYGYSQLDENPEL